MSEETPLIYDEEYAESYNARWLRRGKWRQDADFEEQLLGEILDRRASRKSDVCWLDVGCGTGYFLSRFPGVKRAGMDIAESMLAKARTANPDALFFQRGDFRDPNPDWVDRWDLVSSMWWGYGYVGSVGELEQMITNLCDWTSPSGTCFVPIADIEDLTGLKEDRLPIPYVQRGITDAPGGSLVGDVWITGFVWSWDDVEGNRFSKDLLTLSRGHWMELFGRRFERVDVIRYPPYAGIWNPRKAIVASGKRSFAAKVASDKTLTSPSSDFRPVPSFSPGLLRVAGRRSRYWRRRLIRGFSRRSRRLPLLRHLYRSEGAGSVRRANRDPG